MERLEATWTGGGQKEPIADYGEEFLEHGDIAHCHNFFDETNKVLLIIKIPVRCMANIGADEWGSGVPGSLPAHNDNESEG